MPTPLTIIKNDEVLFDAMSIQEAARYLAEHLSISIYKCYDPIERGYVYGIPYVNQNNEYRFKAPESIANQRRLELEESDHKNARRIWLVPANPSEFDLEKAFSMYDQLDWKKSRKYENGDIFFLYVSGNVRKVRYKVEVIEGKVPKESVYFNKMLWLDKDKLEEAKQYNWTRVRFLDEVDTDELSLEQMRNHGLKGNVQGPMTLKGELRDYVMSFFTKDLSNNYFPDEVPEELEEGKRKIINVNRFERNPLARKRCIEKHGVKCKVCELDFEETYGEVGKDFIHVHHLKPLHEVREDYVVDPENDLIPVCPNCHAMLHRKEEGVFLSVEQLRERVLKVKTY